MKQRVRGGTDGRSKFIDQPRTDHAWFRFEREVDHRVIEANVSDSGAGVAASDLPRVFERYFHRRDPAAEPGTGLGALRPATRLEAAQRSL